MELASDNESDDISNYEYEDILEENRRLREEFEKLKEELQIETQRNEDEEALTKQLEEDKRRLQEEIAELEITRRKLMAEKVFWDFVASFPDFNHWSDFFNKNRPHSA